MNRVLFFIKDNIYLALLIGLLTGQIYFLGLNDWLALLFCSASSAVIFRALRKYFRRARRAGATFARPGSWLHNFLSKEGFNPLFDSFILLKAISTSLIFSFSIKHIYLNIGDFTYGLIPVLYFTTHLIFMDKDSSSKDGNVVERALHGNLNEDFYVYGKTVWHVVYTLGILSVLVALVMAIDDMSQFADIKTIDDVFNYASGQFYELNDKNAVSRKILNYFILSDSMKTYIFNQLFTTFSLSKSYFLVFCLVENFRKYLFFSWSFAMAYLSVKSNRIL